MRLSEIKAKDPKARTGDVSSTARLAMRKAARKMGLVKAIKLTVAEKKAKGTHQKSRDVYRSLDEITDEIQDTLDGIDMMRENMTMAAQGIREKGMYLLSRATNNKGEVVTTEKLNPAFKVQREAMSALKSLKRALVLLREEEQLAMKLEKPEDNEFEGMDL